MKVQSKRNINGFIFILLTIILLFTIYFYFGRNNTIGVRKQEIKTIEITEKQKENTYDIYVDDFTHVEYNKKVFKISDDYRFTIIDGVFRILYENNWDCKIKLVNKKYDKVVSDKSKIKKDLEKDGFKVKNVKDVKYGNDNHILVELKDDKKHIILYRKFNPSKTYRIEIISKKDDGVKVYKNKIKSILDKAK